MFYYSNRTSEPAWADVQVPYGDNSACMRMKTQVFADVHQRSSVLKLKKGKLHHPLSTSSFFTHESRKVRQLESYVLHDNTEELKQ